MLRPSTLRGLANYLFTPTSNNDRTTDTDDTIGSSWSSCHRGRTRRRKKLDLEQRQNSSFTDSFESSDPFQSSGNSIIIPILDSDSSSISSPASSRSSCMHGSVRYHDHMENNDDDVYQTYTSAYMDFARANPFLNNILIATFKSGMADFITQTLLLGYPVRQVNLRRLTLFGCFGAFYIGAFQYLYQVLVFKKIFDLEKFTKQSWSEKIRNHKGLRDLVYQTVLDLAVLSSVYLPTFYVLKAILFAGSLNPSVWIVAGMNNYISNLRKDEVDLITFWLPTDLLCFSVPLHWRLPLRHALSFAWMLYLSFTRGGR